MGRLSTAGITCCVLVSHTGALMGRPTCLRSGPLGLALCGGPLWVQAGSPICASGQHRPLATTRRLVPPIHSGTWMSMIITSLGGPSQLNVGPSLGGAPIFRLTNDSWAEREGLSLESSKAVYKHSGLQMQYSIAALWHENFDQRGRYCGCWINQQACIY